jgi:hypothetical protein
MSPLEFEMLVRDAVRRVLGKLPAEDMHVEFKARWIDEDDLARHIGGMANAALCSPTTLVIGVDEKGAKIVGAESTDVAAWWPQIQRRFNGEAPLLVHHRIIALDEAPDLPFVALMFDTHLAPYVVTNKDGGNHQRDVPWREGTRTQSATRAQLLQILSPIVRMPHLELVQATLILNEKARYDKTGCDITWSLDAKMFVVQPFDQEATFARHSTETIVHFQESPAQLNQVSFPVASIPGVSSLDAVAIRGSNYLTVKTWERMMSPEHIPFPDEKLTVSMRFATPGWARDVSLRFEVVATDDQQGEQNRTKSWAIGHLPQPPKDRRPTIGELATKARR